MTILFWGLQNRHKLMDVKRWTQTYLFTNVNRCTLMQTNIIKNKFIFKMRLTLIGLKFFFHNYSNILPQLKTFIKFKNLLFRLWTRISYPYADIIKATNVTNCFFKHKPNSNRTSGREEKPHSLVTRGLLQYRLEGRMVRRRFSLFKLSLHISSQTPYVVKRIHYCQEPKHKFMDKICKIRYG